MTERSLYSTIAHLGSVALIVGIAALASPSQARMKNPELNSLGAACWDLQSTNDRLIAEYKNATNERREELLQQIRNNGRTWRQIGCQGAYGDISKLVLTPGGLLNGITWDVLVQGGATSDGGNRKPPSRDDVKSPDGGVVLY
jgi:hypothetical protein